MELHINLHEQFGGQEFTASSAVPRGDFIVFDTTSGIPFVGIGDPRRNAIAILFGETTLKYSDRRIAVACNGIFFSIEAN